jgi:hypothetical protein
VKDPENPGSYLLGIECDGATYHSSRSARDRDRLRQEVLQGLGWRLHRIWSTEWYRSPGRELERVLDAIEEARAYRQLYAEKLVEVQQTLPGRPNAIEREDGSPQDKVHALPSERYQRAEITVSTDYHELHELPVDTLVTVVTDVVKVESPIHAKELTRRITEAAGLKRAGSRIQAAVNKALQLGKRRGEIEIRKDFVWNKGMTTPPIRDRSQLENASKKFDWVAPEEIDEALFAEVERSFSTTSEEAISGAARLLGFQRVTSPIRRILATRLEELIRVRRLSEANGSITSTGTLR